MEIIDLTHLIEENMLVFPGTQPPRLAQGNTLEKDGFRETALFMYSHTGTHMDAPAHMLKGAAELDAMPVSSFCGRAAVIPCQGRITMEEIEPYRHIADHADILLFYTGQDRLWGREEYFNAPVPDMEVVRYAIRSGKRGIGIDCMSVDPMEGEMKNHMALFGAGLFIVENLCNLKKAAGRSVGFAALPLKYRGSDGAPVRAIALID